MSKVSMDIPIKPQITLDNSATPILGESVRVEGDTERGRRILETLASAIADSHRIGQRIQCILLPMQDLVDLSVFTEQGLIDCLPGPLEGELIPIYLWPSSPVLLMDRDTMVRQYGLATGQIQS